MADNEPTPDVRTNTPSLLEDIWSLGKPRLSSLVVFTTGGGMFLAEGSPSHSVVLAGIFGTTFVVCSANSLNNYIERETDKLMERTRSRPLPDGRMKPWIALVYGISLFTLALPWIGLATTPLAAGLALLAWLVYVFMYTPLKRKSWLSVLAGGFAGAMPPLIGWTAVTGSIDWGGIALFAILFCWQMPHTFAIGIYRQKEYDAAGMKILPLGDENQRARRHILVWTVALISVSLWVVYLGLGQQLTLAGVVGLGGGFLWKAWTGLKTNGGGTWARDLFLYSLVYLTGLFAVMALDQVL